MKIKIKGLRIYNGVHQKEKKKKEKKKKTLFTTCKPLSGSEFMSLSIYTRNNNNNKRNLEMQWLYPYLVAVDHALH